MKYQLGKVIIGSILLLILFLLPIHPLINKYVHIPETMDKYAVHFYKVNNNDAMTVFSQPESDALVLTSNNIPIKKISTDKKNRISVIPGGHSVGIQVTTDGVIVVGFHQMKEKDGDKSSSPAYDAGLKLGDSIVSLNDTKVESIKDVQQFLSNYNEKQLSVSVKRNGLEQVFQVDLMKNNTTNQLGVYIKDKATGIGTLSFHIPESGQYGALGHIISDNDTKLPIPVKDGTLVRSSVKSIEKGNKGMPGEKHASFVITDDPIGTIDKNSPYGIYGVLNKNKLQNSPFNKPIPIAFYNEIEKGPAEIYTVVDGEKIEAFTVEVLQAKSQSHRATKGIILKVTDEKLLAKTGGIVQGMSGSPIVQNGKLIGAVTHVFVNDPTSGYGVQIEWMLEELGIFDGEALPIEEAS